MQIDDFKALVATLNPGQLMRVSGPMYDTRVEVIAITDGGSVVTRGTEEAPLELLSIDGIMRCGASPHFNPDKVQQSALDAEAEVAEIESEQE